MVPVKIQLIISEVAKVKINPSLGPLQVCLIVYTVSYCVIGDIQSNISILILVLDTSKFEPPPQVHHPPGTTPTFSYLY